MTPSKTPAAAAQSKVPVDVEGHRLVLSNLDKVLYPEAGFTKGQVLDYYTRIAPFLLPHLAGRPLTRKRYPNGVDGSLLLREEHSARAPRLDPHRAAPQSRVDQRSRRHRLHDRR